MIAKSEGASPVRPADLIVTLVRLSGDSEFLHQHIVDEVFHYFAEEAAFQVLQKSLDTPPYQRDREHFDATNNRVRSVRAEIEKMRQRIIKLTEQQ